MLANVALGGQEIEVPAEKLPAEAREIFDAVDAAFAGEYPIRIYSVDVARDADGVYRIIELNSKPGLSWKRGGAGYGEYQQGLARALIAACA
jgi:D-alanine-D-alanine ligase-like ATP-grasp enzyme